MSKHTARTLEVAPAASELHDAAGTPVVAVAPTQLRRPWRSTARTAFQALVALAVLFPILVQSSGLDPNTLPWLAVPLAVAAAIARLMALPQVEAFLQQFAPFLSAAGAPPQLPDPADVTEPAPAGEALATEAADEVADDQGDDVVNGVIQ